MDTQDSIPVKTKKDKAEENTLMHKLMTITETDIPWSQQEQLLQWVFNVFG